MSISMQLVLVVLGFIVFALFLPSVVLWHRLLYATILPELVLLGSHRDRNRALRAAQRSVSGWFGWDDLLFAVALTGPWILLGRGPWVGSHSLLPFLAVFLFAPAIVATALFYGLFRNRLRRSLRRQLAEGGHAICASCGYDLRGQTEPRCPECGHAVVAVAEPGQEPSLQ